MMEVMIFSCDNCGNQITVQTGDFQEVCSVFCDCTREMEFEGFEGNTDE